MGPLTGRIKEIKTGRKELGRCDSYCQAPDMGNKKSFVKVNNCLFNMPFNMIVLLFDICLFVQLVDLIICLIDLFRLLV